MLEVKIVVEIPGLVEAIRALGTMCANRATATPHDAEIAPNTAPAVPAASTAPVAPVAPVQTPAPVNPPSAAPAAPTAPVAPVAPSAPVPAPATPATPTPPWEPASAAEPAVTMQAVSRAGAELVDKGKMTELIAVLKKYGVAAVTQLSEAALPAVAADLRALGATI